MQQTIWKRLVQLVILWSGSVLILAAVSTFFRPLMTVVRLKS